jgi:hypothetical protein
MSRNSSGVYSVASSSWNTAVTGTVIDPDVWNSLLTDLTSALNFGTTGATDNRLIRSDGTGGLTFQSSAVTVDDSGNMSGVGTLSSGAITATGLNLSSGAVVNWNSSDLTLTHSADTLTLVGGSLVLPAAGLTVGASIPFSDSAGTLTLQNIDALDATTESTIEAAIDTLANLTSVQGQTLTLAGAFITSGANSLTLTTTGATNVTLPTTGTLATLAGAETFSNKTLTAPKFADLGFIADANGNELIILDTVTSAVNEVTLANAATAGSPTLTATGGDTNIDLTLAGKGTGGVIATFTNTGVHILDTDATHDLIIAPGSNLTADRTLTLTTLDASRTIIISGNATISQDYSTSGSPTFANPLVTTLEVANADTTISRSAAGVIAVEGVVIPSISSANTLTNKTIDLTSNTLVGSVTEFNTALESADFGTFAAAATDNAAVRSDGTGGLLQTSALIISDTADLTAYNATNDGNPVLAFGASATERLTVTPTYDTGAQTLSHVVFATDVASATADKGLFRFSPDGTAVLDIDDGGINFAASKGISIAGTDILTDAAGTATLSNIDALDATTETTIEAAIDTLANLTSIQGQTVTLAGAFITSGANSLTLTTTGATNVTLPTSGTLATRAGSESLSNKTLPSPITTGTLDIQEALVLSGDISPAQITVDQNNYAPTGFSTASTLRLSTDASRTLTGLAGGADGRVILIHNIGAQDLVLADESASSTAANRFALNAAVTIAADQTATLRYDATSSRWRVISSPGGTAGGGSLNNVVEDLTPQLGGDLDANAFNIGFDDATGIEDDSGNEQLIFQKTTTAVSYWEMTNAATGGKPSLQALGETNVIGQIKGNGTGGIEIEGTATTDDATAGYVGEYVVSNINRDTSAVSLTNDVEANMTSISLTAGDWDVTGNVVFSAGGGTTISQLRAGINTTSATFPAFTGNGDGAFVLSNAPYATSGSNWLPVGTRRISVSATTTVYMVVEAFFSVSTMTAAGCLRARRIR